MLTSKDLELIKTAIESKTIIRFGYRSTRDEFSLRRVEPYELREGMLWCFDLNKESTRSFVLDRMHGLIVTNEGFTPRF